MARPGRKIKSLEEHKLTGTYQKSRHGSRVPTNTMRDKTPPAEFVSDLYALWMWDHVLTTVNPDILAQTDDSDLYAICQTWSHYRNLDDQIKTMSVATDESYCEVFRLYLTVLNQYCKLSDRFGMNPAARTRIKMNTKPKESNTNPLLAIAAQRKQA